MINHHLENVSSEDLDDNQEICVEKRAVKRSERGTSLVEYALLIVLITLALISAVGTLGGDVSGKLKNTHDVISASTGDS